MSWFGGGKKEESPAEKGFMSDDASAMGGAGVDISSLGGGSMDGGGTGMSEFQQFSLSLQQQMVVQQAISDLSQRAFDKCVTKMNDPRLGGKEVACIHAVTNKWLDSNEYMVGRLAKKQQAMMQQQQGGYS